MNSCILPLNISGIKSKHDIMTWNICMTYFSTSNIRTNYDIEQLRYHTERLYEKDKVWHRILNIEHLMKRTKNNMDLPYNVTEQLYEKDKDVIENLHNVTGLLQEVYKAGLWPSAWCDWKPLWKMTVKHDATEHLYGRDKAWHRTSMSNDFMTWLYPWILICSNQNVSNKVALLSLYLNLKLLGNNNNMWSVLC